jgi:RND superfamily putative drug exporter
LRAIGRALARLFVAFRYLVVLAWIAVTVWAVVKLPAIQTTAETSFTSLVPKNSPAVIAEQASAEQFAFPVLTRTMIVVRNPHGLSVRRQLQLVQLAKALSLHQLPAFGDVAGAVPVSNAVGRPPFFRDRGTTAIMYLYFRPSVSSSHQLRAAERLVRFAIGHHAGEYEGVTGEIPAGIQQTDTVNKWLPWVELATILLVALVLLVHFRAPAPAALTIFAIAVSYLLAERVVAEFASRAGVSVPAEVQPVLVVLIFGVVTDYSIFFQSRFRALLTGGHDRIAAASLVIREIAPIVFVAGLTVAAGTAALLVASLGFLRGFGPALAIAVLIAMAVAVTLVPAVLATLGWRTFWPRSMPGGAAPTPASTPVEPPRRNLIVKLSARHPIPTILFVLALIGGGASGLARMKLGNELVVGLPAHSRSHYAYTQAKKGFAAGILAPAVVVVTGTAVGYQHAALVRLQKLLAAQPGVALVVGPAQQPFARRFGFAIARTGDAARYVMFLNSDPLSARAIGDIGRLRDKLPQLVARARIPLGMAAVAGDTAISADIVHGTVTSLKRVLPTALAVIFILIAIFLRALVAPIYLVATSVLATLATLGVTAYVMQIGFGYGQITYYVVFTVAVLLISLGSDYNVFLAGRIWQEGRRRWLSDAVEVAGTRAARPITTAGSVLAASFALLVMVPLRPFREIAFAMTLGLLIDTFLIRTLLVPALVSLFGTLSAWPGSTLREPV